MAQIKMDDTEEMVGIIGLLARMEKLSVMMDMDDKEKMEGKVPSAQLERL